MEYVARFEVGEITGQTQEERRKMSEVKPEKSVDKKGIDTKIVGKTLTVGVAATALGGQVYQTLQTTKNTIRGDSIAQQHLNNQMAYLNEGLRIGGALGIAAIVNPATLGATAIALGLSYGVKAFQTAQANEVKQAQWQIESLVNAEKQKRLVMDITGVRV